MTYSNKEFSFTNIFSNSYITANNILKLYHGTKRENLKPSYNYKTSRDLLVGFEKVSSDLGNGFYLADSYNDAVSWCALGEPVGRGFVYTYEINLEDFTVFDFRTEFSSDVAMIKAYAAMLLDNHYLNSHNYNVFSCSLFIDKYRPKNIYSYDIIIAPRLDSSYTHILEDFGKDVIDFKTFKTAITLGELGYQFYIQSQKAFSAVSEYSECTYIDSLEVYRESSIQLSNAKYEYLKLKSRVQNKKLTISNLL